jgi:iron(III) transport system ATP-binding protein
MSDIAVEVRDLRIDLTGPRTDVVDEISLDIEPGEVLGLVGESGSGKTTVGMALLGHVRRGGAVGGGAVVIDGRDLAQLGGADLRKLRGGTVAYIPQDPGTSLNPALRLRTQLSEVLEAHAGSWGEQERIGRLREALEEVALPSDDTFLARYPHQLSGGQQQRVALARALAPNPTVVLLDEPFSSLDASLRASTGQAVVRALRAAAATAVLVTHDQDEALSLADQVAVMRAGRLVQADAPGTLYRSPVDADVARFVGGATALPARVVDGVATCVLGDLDLARPCPDGAAQVLVRPEQVRLDGAGSGSGVEATVAEVSFYGHDAACRLDLHPDGPALVARLIGLDAPEVGSVVKVGVAGGVVAFPG